MSKDEIIWDDEIVWDNEKNPPGTYSLTDLLNPRGREPDKTVYPHVKMGARQAWDASAQMLARGVEGIVPSVRNSREQMEAQIRADYEAYKARSDPDASTIASLLRGGGQSLAFGPLAPAMASRGIVGTAAQAAGIGAAGGVMTPVYDVPEGSSFWKEKAKQAGLGAAVGGPLGVAGNVLSKTVAPKIGEQVKALLDAKIPLTPGQTLGGIVKSIEDRAAGWPIVGDAIMSARSKGIDEFNRAMYRRALAPFGDEGAAVVNATTIGHDGIRKIGDFLSRKYEAALAQSVPSVIDDNFRRSVNQLHTMVPKALRDDFAAIINQQIVPTPGNTITPSVAKTADVELGRLAASYRGSAIAAERELARALGQAQAELRQLFARHNPNTAPLIRAADNGYRTLVQIENAGAMLGAKEGVFTPAQILNAIKKGDKSVRDRASARGEAHNQQFVEAADAVLPNKVPDSGTAGRLGLLGVVARPDMALLGGTAGLAYTPGTSALLRAAMTKRPDWAEPLARQLQRASPYVGLLGAYQVNQ